MVVSIANQININNYLQKIVINIVLLSFIIIIILQSFVYELRKYVIIGCALYFIAFVIFTKTTV